jgi:hypothetical protein
LLNPGVIPETVSRINNAAKPGQRATAIDDFLSVIQARYEMLNAF